ncbi:EAL domain-containing protein [Spongorhabdus nitratireducens]
MTASGIRTIRLLIIDESEQDAETLINVFRKAGYSTRAQHVTSPESLDASLHEKHGWDLFLARGMPDSDPVAQAMEKLQELSRDVPLILLVDHYDDSTVREGLKTGMRDVVPLQDHERLLLTAERELRSLQDRRQRRQMEVALKAAEKQKIQLLHTASEAIACIREEQLLYVNKALTDFLGYDDPKELSGQMAEMLIIKGKQQAFRRFMAVYEKGQQAVGELQCNARRKNGDPVRARLLVTPGTFNGEACLQLVISDAGSESKSHRVELHSARDKVTGLYNQAWMREQLDLALQNAVSDKGSSTVMLLVLDGLEAMLKQHGLDISNIYLQSLGELLGKQLAQPIKLARFGKGAFVALINDDHEERLQQLADETVKAVSQLVVDHQDNKLRMTATAGMVLLTETCSEVDTILVRAKNACKKARQQVGQPEGKRTSFHKMRKVQAVESDTRELASVVMKAMTSNGLKLMFQPIVSLKGDPAETYQVHLRVVDEKGEEQSASKFIKPLEKTKLWLKVDRWVVTSAIKRIVERREKGKQTRLFLHIGAATVLDKEFTNWLKVTLKAADLPSDALVFEISEENAISWLPQAKELITGINSTGASAGLCHFGGSLHPLKSLDVFPAQYIKFDGSFAAELNKSDEKGEELQKMVEAVSAKDRKIIIPKIESAAELSPLWHLGIDYVQGFFLAPPGPKMDYDFSS